MLLFKTCKNLTFTQKRQYLGWFQQLNLRAYSICLVTLFTNNVAFWTIQLPGKAPPYTHREHTFICMLPGTSHYSKMRGENADICRTCYLTSCTENCNLYKLQWISLGNKSVFPQLQKFDKFILLAS